MGEWVVDYKEGTFGNLADILKAKPTPPFPSFTFYNRLFPNQNLRTIATSNRLLKQNLSNIPLPMQTALVT